MKTHRILTISHSATRLIRGATALLLLAAMSAAFAAPFTLNPLYDNNGNTLNIGKTYFVYSDNNRLSEVRQGSINGKIVESYVVDPVTGQRIKKIINAKSVKGGNNKPKGGGGGGNPVTVYYPFKEFLTVVGGKQAGDYSYYFASGSRIAKKDNKGSYSFIHADHLGSAHVITDDTGNLIERTTHQPYGAIRTGGEEDRYSFTGKELDTTDIFDFHARSYDPFVRSFLQPDTVVPLRVDQIRMANVPGEAYRFEDSFGVNSYLYANANPALNVDPDGNAALSAQARQALQQQINAQAAIQAEFAAVDRSFQRIETTLKVAQTAGAVADAALLALSGGTSKIALEAFEQGAKNVAKRLFRQSTKNASTLKPGPFAKESIPAHRGKPTAAEQRQVNEIMEKRGCHTCGIKNPGTKSGNAVADHQPPQSLAKPKEFFPHCINCSRRQGGQVLQEIKRNQ